MPPTGHGRLATGLVCPAVCGPADSPQAPASCPAKVSAMPQRTPPEASWRKSVQVPQDVYDIAEQRIAKRLAELVPNSPYSPLHGYPTGITDPERRALRNQLMAWGDALAEN